MCKNSKAKNIRFEKEAEALKKNLAKRKKQQQLRQQNAKSKDTKYGQD
jgi:hypothetical protein